LLVPEAGRLWLCVALAALTACGEDRPPRLLLGTTHTVEDSGVLDVLTRAWYEDHGSDRRLSVVVAGSGEVLAMAARGDVDAVLSHAPDGEIALLAAGGAESRRRVMRNDFVLLGPLGDPANVQPASSAAEAFRRIAAARHAFISRGDDSGTHRKEEALWLEAEITRGWSGFVEAGTGMADALRLASQRGAYILSDRATYEVLRADLMLEVAYEDERELVNAYSVLVVRGAADAAGAREFAEWLTGARAQALIAGYRAPSGTRALFVPAASSDSP
jgi:tungstate transport system substrate-binding protein